MSQYEELTTTMTDQQYLVEALTEMGYKPEVQTEGTALRGYGGVSWNGPVQVTIPREQLRGALAPVGFGRDETGAFQAVIDDLDRKCSGLDESWLGRVARAYKERQTMADSMMPVLQTFQLALQFVYLPIPDTRPWARPSHGNSITVR